MRLSTVQRRIALVAGGAALVASLATAGAVTAGNTVAGASSGPVSVSSVTVTNYPSNPIVTVDGANFGRRPPHGGVSPSTLSNCNSGTGVDYPKSELWFLDASRSGGLSGAFQEGSEFSAGVGNCGGIILSEWSETQIQYTFGSRYLSDGHYLESGDVVCADVRLVPACTTLP
ncbi:MAG: hypothetical protein WB565_00265 [Acidimicrobiales bacterium]